MLCREAANTHLLVFGLTPPGLESMIYYTPDENPGLESMIYYTPDENPNYYTTDTVQM